MSNQFYVTKQHSLQEPQKCAHNSIAQGIEIVVG